MERQINSKNLIIIFYRNPVKGAVKTRLAAGIGDEAALTVYKQLSEMTMKAVRPVASEKIVYYDQYIIHDDIWTEDDFEKNIQAGSDLGERMAAAFRHGFKQGYDRILIIGTDCPDLTTGMLEDAFNLLDTRDAVIGPAVDGGYYLLGLKRFIPEVFQDMVWGSDQVFQQTMIRLKQLGQSVCLLEPLRVIDRPEDLDQWGGFQI
jgi:rSAM/selenodomain-associated transferase 1